jgi:alpha-D-xyloside xylohydrolase
MQVKRARLSMIATMLICAIAVATAQTTAKPTGIDKADQLTAVQSAQSDQGAFAWTGLQSGVQIRVGGIVKNVLFYGPRIVRVNTTLGKVHTTQPSLAVIVHPEAIPFRVDEKPGQLIVASAELTVVIDKQTGALTFLKPDGAEITRERAEKPAELKEVTISGDPTYEVKQTFTLAPDESLYGLGNTTIPTWTIAARKF